MKKVDFVFVILTYINSSDLKDFFDSVAKLNLDAACIVVDAYHDNENSRKIEIISKTYNAEYIQIPNNGYGYGNNCGIEYANNKYEYKFIIISNPDIIVEQLDIKNLYSQNACIIGPQIKNAKKQMQNPMYVTENLFAQRLVYWGLKTNRKFIFMIGIGINKIKRKCFLKRNKRNISQVYQIHGCFVIFGNETIKQLGKVYDENIFLFAEESYLAVRLKKLGIKTIYNPNILVTHKEDGSMGFRDDIGEQIKKSNIYVFEKYYNFS